MAAGHRFYARSQNQGHTVGLLIQTTDRDEASHQAELACDDFDDFSDQEILLDVQKVLIR
jgi:hypothetical protein